MNIAFGLLALNTTIIACIVVAAVVVCAVVAAIIILAHNKHSSKKSQSENAAQRLLPANSGESAASVDNALSDEKPEDGSADNTENLFSEIDGVHEEINKLTKELDEVAGEPVAAEQVVHRVAPAGKVLIRVRYNRSYTAKIIQSDDVVKSYYEELKNEIMSYNKVSNRISWRHETFRRGRKLLIRMAIRGKTLGLYFALNPADYEDTKYKINDVSMVAKNATVPVLYKIKNDRRLKYAKDLIAAVMAENEMVAGEPQSVDYKSQYPYEELEPLIDRKLVKLLTWNEEVTDSEVGVIAVPVEHVTEEIAAAAEVLPEDVEVVEEPEEEIAESPVPVAVEQVVHRVAPAGKVLIRVRYNRSYTAKIIQSDDVVKSYYEELKNEIMSYNKVSNRISWRHETFRRGRKLLIRMAIRGKTLGLYFALNPADYEDTKYKINDVSMVAKNATVPVLYKIKNDRRLKYAKDLIAAVMAENEMVAGEPQSVDYKSQYPYEELEPLIDRKLVKLLTWNEEVTDSEVGVIAVPVEQVPEEVAAAAEEICEEPEEIVPELVEEQFEEEEEEEEEIAEEVFEQPELPVFEEGEEIEESVKNFFEEEDDEDVLAKQAQAEEQPDVNLSINAEEVDEILDDQFVEAFVRTSTKTSDKTRKAIVNIDTLEKYFQSGETVTIELLKERIPSIGKNTTYVKVLARGTLAKALTVEADDFSPQAIKMIVLTGGKVVRNKRT